jgi:hypothetical protein
MKLIVEMALSHLVEPLLAHLALRITNAQLPQLCLLAQFTSIQMQVMELACLVLMDKIAQI